MIQSTPPLLIEDAATGTSPQVKRGTMTQRIFKIRNLGEAAEASVNFWLETTDRKSEALLNWYTFDRNPPVKIPQGEVCEITLSFEVPLQATVSLYNYTIVVEALQYANSFRRPMQLQLMPSEQDLEIDLDPGFSLEPITTSTQPHPLNAGETFTLTVKVENRSKLTDRFYLTCPDLPKDWVTIHYPESAVERFGVIQETEGLQLNPESTGEVVLQIHPPPHTLAGNYFPTLQLTSRNREDLILLDVVYLHLLPDPRLDAVLSPTVRRIPEDPNQFDLQLTNLGNLQRHLVLTGTDADRLFRYLFSPHSLLLAPGDSQSIALYAKPQRWWKRPLKGKEIKFPFEIGLQEQIEIGSEDATETTLIPVSQLLPQGTIVWLPRPWWVSKLLWLLLLLPLLGLVGLLLYLWLNRPQPLPAPEVLTFAPDQIGRDYQEGKEPIRLNWRVNRLEQIDKLTVIRLENNVETYRKSYFFNRPEFSGSLPSHLQQEDRADNFCTETPEKPFRNGIRPKLDQTHRFLNIPYPYLAWEMVPTKTLVCQGIITPTRKAGNYTFQLQVFRRSPNADQPATSQTTDTIVIRPNQEPKIVKFASDRLIYDEMPNTTGLVRLNWQIANANRIEELQLVTLSPDGKAQGELKRYSMLNGAVPPELQAFCTPGAELICTNVPTDVQKAGDYIFKLILRVRQEGSIEESVTKDSAGKDSSTEIVKQTEPIKVVAKPVRILSFQVNGQNAKQNPKQTYLFNRRANAPAIALSWQVEGGAGTKVELLPAPGEVQSQGSMNFVLNSPGTQTITLRATSAMGEQQEQSVVVQTVEVPDPNQAKSAASPAPASSQPANATSGTGNPASQPSDRAAPSPIGNPEPIELPPRAH